MPEFKGRPLIFLIVAGGSWVVFRTVAAIQQGGDAPTDRPLPEPSSATARAEHAGQLAPSMDTGIHLANIREIVAPTTWPIVRGLRGQSASVRIARTILRQPATRSVVTPPVAIPSKAVAVAIPTPNAVTASVNAEAAPMTTGDTALRPPPVNVYAYTFWRDGSAGSGLASAGQYGGSQSGIIATWNLGATFPALAKERLSLIGRLSGAHDDSHELEAAAGIRWQPIAKLPISLTVEQRVRPRGVDRLAVYAAGGVDRKPLPVGFHLDAYGQAGWASNQEGGYFFDGIARAQRPLIARDKGEITAGAGAWTGGQKGAQRLDIGPTAGGTLRVGKASFRLSADWRFRIAGNASPGDGPALTLSTGF